MDSLFPKTEEDELCEALDEIKREIIMRERVYPRMIDSGKLAVTEAHRRIACMKKAASVISDVLKRGNET